MATLTHFVRKSGNDKTGPIPVTTTERATCWKGCALYGAGCYADGGPLAMHWRAVSSGERAWSWREMLAAIKALPPGQVWRHNQAGDLPGKSGTINPGELRQLVAANKGRSGFTYTHKPPTAKNLALIGEANSNGFTVNLSANSPAHADQLSVHGLPVVAIIPDDGARRPTTPKGRRIVPCLAQLRPDINCGNCGKGKPLCARPDRSYVVGFYPHGFRKGKAAAIASR